MAHRRNSFWQDFGEYLLEQFSTAVKVFLGMAVLLFLAASLVVGMYVVSLYFLRGIFL